jgi:hypothetical protein
MMSVVSNLTGTGTDDITGMLIDIYRIIITYVRYRYVRNTRKNSFLL